MTVNILQFSEIYSSICQTIFSLFSLSEEYISSPLGRILDVDSHLSVQLGLFVVISLVLSPGKKATQGQVEEHWADE